MNNNYKKSMITGCIMAAICIALGAFGAHGLKQVITQDSLSIYITGNQYHMYHALALVGLGAITNINNNTRVVVYWFFLVGILLFSGSLYLLALKDVLPFNTSILGPVTPIGGLLFILGWLRLGYGVFKN